MKGRRKTATEVIDGPDLETEPPANMDADASKVWVWAVESCKEAGRPLKHLHAETLKGLCEAAADVERAGRIIDKDGVIIDGGRDGMKRHPAASMRTQALTIKRAYLAELGLTPTSSARLPAAPKTTEINPFADI